MKVLIQRVSQASVEVEGQVVSNIPAGLLLLVGFEKGDDESKLKPAAKKVSGLRIFSDENGRFMHSVLDTKGSVLAVSQFTLLADTSKGRRPEFFRALEPEAANTLFNKFLAELSECGIEDVQAGVFGAMMKVSLLNDGPVTISLDF